MKIHTEISINSSPENVWSILTDLENHRMWNPFFEEISGELKKGKKINVKIDGTRFRPEILVLNTNHEFRWKGKLFFSGLFDGEHVFRLNQISENQVLFIHEEIFSGILVPLFKSKLLNETRAGFEQMNKALKKRVE
ncbi:SRPBCC domain-containing protein [Marinigracilibium pacificum]|uniref:SRPBCC domain-containing protein n=1 Tax=Marinigracilibium pacificum TaxID=2729599 RepID=A0A848IZ08_9BACT|nr:SRPBCC domain-containing protein [Marinigracilibium pacificum]NMM48515.1 SRPBCC domain-containing protein [Marinigracilibium pacificum]